MTVMTTGMMLANNASKKILEKHSARSNSAARKKFSSKEVGNSYHGSWSAFSSALLPVNASTTRCRPRTRKCPPTTAFPFKTIHGSDDNNYAFSLFVMLFPKRIDSF